MALLVAPDSVLLVDGTPPGVTTDWLALPLRDSVVRVVLTAARLVTLLALPAALALVVVRHRRADDPERTQLRWLLWAGIVCVLSVLVFLVVPAGALTTAVLALAVVLVSVSVAVGVVRPDLADVDALVAGTLTYAGVAVVVVGIDLAMLAAADRALSGRLDQREVTILVLVVAVAVYSPPRTWLGALVRRLLFGRRGDRYGVVSSFAALMERSARVEDQLPALAEAVAGTKVRHVLVEVFVPGGGTHRAAYGAAGGETHELDIAYRGERIGRLVLARSGMRALLSHRDQALLIDLVRQAAIAIRTGLLARQLQESRERLVLGREEDRWRIRRDLHDGLGPVLGGVAMRMDAAGNAVEADPETASRLVRQARTEVADALDDVRRLVHGLRPPALDDLGLLPAVEQQAERVRTLLSMSRCWPRTSAPPPAAVEVAAFRIVSEALANVVKHAHATRCRITLQPTGTRLEVLVVDDGRGIDADVTAGVGLLSLRERAEELGGQCSVSCPDEGGTRVWALLPYGEDTTSGSGSDGDGDGDGDGEEAGT